MMEMQSAPVKGSPTQKLVDIAEIRDDVVIMKDNTLRAVMLVSSVNFALKSEQEQNAIVYAYQDFLNSLDFPIQIAVTSRKIDIMPYLDQVRQLRRQQTNELLRLQMDEYINFIANDLVKSNNIMTKTFMIVVPFSLGESKRVNFFTKLFKNVKSTTTVPKAYNDQDFYHYRTQLFQRLEQAAVGLQAIGLRVVPLRSRELLELYYTLYNPASSRNQHLRYPESLQVQETDSAM
jgi:hypothetical protein